MYIQKEGLMSLVLVLGTKPYGLTVKTHGFGSLGNTVFLGDYEISLEDFLYTAEYVLTNTDLEKDDPRLKFVKYIQSMKEVDGYMPNRRRLEAPEQAVFEKS